MRHREEMHRQSAATHVEFAELNARNVLQLEADVGRSVRAGDAQHEDRGAVCLNGLGIGRGARGRRAAASGERQNPRREGEMNFHVRVCE